MKSLKSKSKSCKYIVYITCFTRDLFFNCLFNILYIKNGPSMDNKLYGPSIYKYYTPNNHQTAWEMLSLNDSWN